VGWGRTHRVYPCIFHFDIKDDKIWLKENNTDRDVSPGKSTTVYRSGSNSRGNFCTLQTNLSKTATKPVRD